MMIPVVTYTDLQHMHHRLCLVVPLEKLSPVVVMMLTMVTCQWKHKKLGRQTKLHSLMKQFH